MCLPWVWEGGWCYVCVCCESGFFVEIVLGDCTRRILAHLRCTQYSILLHIINICFITCIYRWQISQIQTFLYVVVRPGFCVQAFLLQFPLLERERLCSIIQLESTALLSEVDDKRLRLYVSIYTGYLYLYYTYTYTGNKNQQFVTMVRLVNG